ncbi:unnamed protein product [Ascophyllum nodosum]
MVDIVGDELLEDRKMASTFGAGDLARGWVGPTEGWKRTASGEARLDVSVGSWSLGEPNAEVLRGEAGYWEEGPERRTRRTHCGRPCDNWGSMVRCLSVPLFSFVCIGHRVTEGCHRWRLLRTMDKIPR